MSSKLEKRFALALKAWGADLPEPEVEFRFHPTRRWRFDYAFPEHRLAVELDGGRWFAGGGKHGTDADYEKLNAAQAAGWRVLRFTPTMLEDSKKVIREVREALRESTTRDGNGH